jgi:hypothetical protein
MTFFFCTLLFLRRFSMNVTEKMEENYVNGTRIVSFPNVNVENTETQYGVRLTRFCFSSCMVVFLGNIDGWVKDFRYILTQSQIHLACTLVALLWGRTVGIASNCGWEKTVFWVNICESQLWFLSSFIQIVTFCMRFSWLYVNSRY